MRHPWAHIGLSPLSIYSITYLFQAIEFILIVSAFRYFFYEPSQGILIHSISIQERTAIVMLSLAVFPAGQFLFTVFFGSFSDAFGRRKALISTQSIWLFSYLFSALGLSFFSFPLFLIGRGLMGFAGSFYSIGLASLCDIYENGFQRIKAYGFLSAVQGILSAVLLLLLASLPVPSIDPVSSPLLLICLAAGTSALNFFLIYTNLPETNHEALPFSFRRMHVDQKIGKILREPQMKPLLFFYFASTFLFMTPCSSMAIDLASRMMNHNHLLIFVALFAAGWAASSFFILPYLFKKYPARRILSLTWIFAGLLFAAYLPLPFLMFQILLFIGSAIAFGIAASFLLWMIGKLVPDSQSGRSLGLAHMLFCLAILVGPFASSYALIPASPLAIAFFSIPLLGIGFLFSYYGLRLRPEICEESRR